MRNSASGEAAKAVVRRNTEEVQSKGDFDVFEELFADEFVDHTPQPGVTPGQARRTRSLQGHSGGLPRLPRRHPLAETAKPLHRAILENYLRHVALEISGYWDQILVPELSIAEPVYRVSERGQVHVLTGHAEVERFYREIHATGQSVIAARTLNLAVGDFGVITEAVWNHMTPGATLVGEIPDADPHAHYLISHHIMQTFAYTSDAKLIGERVYDDPASYRYEKLAPADVVTREIARAQLAPFLACATSDVRSRGGAGSTGACRVDRATLF